MVREASNWFVRMHGPQADDHRAAFDAWMAASDRHRDAYSRVSEAFSLGKNIDVNTPLSSGAARPNGKRSGRRIGVIAGLAVLSIGGTSVAVYRFLQGTPSINVVVAQASRFETGTGEIRRLRLSDGSTVTLDTGSRLVIAFGPGRRDLRLFWGRARFDVAHEARPFVVAAGGGTVTAHGTLFDVRVDAGNASVRLIRGSIDVALPQSTRRPFQLRRMAAGEAVTFSEDRGISPAPSSQAPAIVQAAWPSALLEFDHAYVAEVVAEANRYSSTRLRVDDPALARLPLSGTFRVGDSERLADSLSILLDARVDHAANGDVVLQPPLR